jgi:hypothetical protein
MTDVLPSSRASGGSLGTTFCSTHFSESAATDVSIWDVTVAWWVVLIVFVALLVLYAVGPTLAVVQARAPIAVLESPALDHRCGAWPSRPTGSEPPDRVSLRPPLGRGRRSQPPSPHGDPVADAGRLRRHRVSYVAGDSPCRSKCRRLTDAVRD